MENHALKDASEAITTLQNWQSMKPNEVQQVIDRLEGYITQASKPPPPQADTPIKGAGDEMKAFEKYFKGYGLDFTKSKDAWGKEIYKHTHIDAMWAGWQAAQREDVSGEPKITNWNEAVQHLQGRETTPAPIDADKVRAIETAPEFPDKSNPEAIEKFKNDLAWWYEREFKYIRAALKKGG